MADAGLPIGYPLTRANIESGVITGITAFATTTASTVGFYGADRTVQPADANQAALTFTTALTGGVGFTTATAFSALTAQLENIRASLVLLGLLKGSA